ncbi:PqiC family protein [Methylophaga sp.]|uniref:PqiC family protein n=1 Tax=Methylophaga sp. TaxID=2024840 RepID=UPI003F69D598
MTFKSYLSVVLIILLAGCATTSVESQRYFLPAPDGVATPLNKVDSSRLLQITEVQLADFLDEAGLILQLDDITLNQAKNHLWAEELGRQINRNLRERLNQKQHNFIIVGPETSADLRLLLEINAFHGRYDGLALTSGQWQLQNKQGEIMVLNRFELGTKLNKPGYPALVRALGENLDKLAILLAEELAQVQ